MDSYWKYEYIARSSHTASVLLDRRVLVTGGCYGASSNTAEIYDPSTGIWTLASSMNATRTQHTTSLLANGKVLVTGGLSSSGSVVLSTSEIYQP